ncbi:MAG: hypothetical protein GY869_13955 [Planctomycetes bacterium]|nr:hypothetical protein [Planctomycetota bacterium]
MDSVGIISDFLILKDASGSDDYYVVEESKLAESRLLEGARAYLEGKGYGIRYMLSPYVGLLNLKSGQVIWSNSLRFKKSPTSEFFFEKTWPKSMFYHFPERISPNQ